MIRQMNKAITRSVESVILEDDDIKLFRENITSPSQDLNLNSLGFYEGKGKFITSFNTIFEGDGKIRIESDRPGRYFVMDEKDYIIQIKIEALKHCYGNRNDADVTGPLVGVFIVREEWRADIEVMVYGKAEQRILRTFKGDQIQIGIRITPPQKPACEQSESSESDGDDVEKMQETGDRKKESGAWYDEGTISKIGRKNLENSYLSLTREVVKNKRKMVYYKKKCAKGTLKNMIKQMNCSTNHM